VLVASKGYSPAAGQTFRMLLELTEASPLASGLQGGVQVNITGSGFAAAANRVPTVSIGNTECLVVTVVDTSIVCMTEPVRTPQTIRIYSASHVLLIMEACDQ
jgi:hypothetical protein